MDLLVVIPKVKPGSGVTFQDLFKDVENQTPEEKSTSDVFTTADKWVRSTDKDCSNCALPIQGAPVPLPSKKEKYQTHVGYMPLYFYCSFECAHNDIYNKFSKESERRYYKRLLDLVALEFDIQDYGRAPNKEKMKKYYGGTITEEEYRACVKQLFIQD
jgi:hypothetical protein